MRDAGRQAHLLTESKSGAVIQSAPATQFPALAGIRIGCVKYLNAKPLISGYDGPVRLEHPSELARDIVRGELDAALVPVFEALGSRPYLLVDGAAIASAGPVYSVFLAHRGPLEKIQSVALDPASLTSVHLLQVLLAEYHGLKPRLLGLDEAAEADAQLIIGNQAIEFRASATSDFQYLDLGEEWQKRTGLPFVYALWLLRPDLPGAHEVAREFRALKRDGVSRIAEIVRLEQEGTLEFRRRYLTQHIRFDLGPEEKAGLERFRELLGIHGFVSKGPPSYSFV